MDTVIDFSSCQRIHESFGGTDRKFGVIYNGDKYMLKFAEAHAKKHDISTSYVNNVLSEYISSHITRAIGMPAHETVIGVYNDTLVVGCKDFRKNDNVRNIEFSEYVRSTYDSKDVKRIIKLNQIYETLKDRDNAIPEELQEATIQRYWDTFVIDALVGNFDRHIGNWGYLAENNHLKLAPIYDFGSTLFPNMSDEGARTFLGNQHEMLERCLVFPSPALVITDEKVGKVGYYDMLASNYDENCTAALLRIAPKIDMNKIRDVVDNTPLISPVRKQFYKEILQMRKELIIDRAFLRCFYKEYDRESLNRLHQGHQFSESDLKCFIFERNAHEQDFVQNEELLAEAFKNSFHSAQEIADLVTEQKRFMELYGFHSNHVWDNVCTDYREQNFQTENQHKAEEKKGSFTLFCGLPLSGKTAEIKSRTEYNTNSLIVSLSDLRELYGDEIAQELVHKRIANGIRQGKDVYYDAVNLRKDTRDSILETALNAGSSNNHLVFMDAELSLLKKRAKRTGFDLGILRDMYDILQSNLPILDVARWDTYETIKNREITFTQESNLRRGRDDNER